MRNIEAAAISRAGKSKRWPLIVISLLGGHVLVMFVAVTIALRDPSFAVEPHYYQKAVNWDQTREQLRDSARLGWTVKVQAGDAVDPLGRRAVTFVVADARGRAIDGAALTVDYFHHAHADRESEVTLSGDASDPRRFSQSLPMRYAGTWEFHFLVKAGNKTFVASTTELLKNAGGDEL